MNARLAITALLILCVCLSACLATPPTQIPIPSIETRKLPRNDTLVIMLPGRGDRAETFIEHEFQLEGRHRGFDTIAVDAHFGYYKTRSLLPRLHEDIVLPAKAAGYKRIWLLGVSMGGFGSLLYAAEYPDNVDGIILLAPYLGDRKLAESIKKGGGLAAWPGEADGYKDYEVKIWAWLKNATESQTGTPVVIGYGEADRSARSHAVLADALQASRVYTRNGGHEWVTWRPLWKQIANDLEL